MARDAIENEQFGPWLKVRRKALGLSRRELALRANCSEVTIVKVEAGERRPSVQVAGLLASVLGIPPEDHARFIEFARSHPNDPPAAATQTAPPLPGTPADGRGPLPSPANASSRRAPVTLPSPLTSFVGREEALGAALDLLRGPDVRLLTLTGPPGIGKTRLGLRIAEEAAGDFEHGVSFVPLDTVRAPDLLVPAVAGVLGIHERAGSSLRDDLGEYLKRKQLLLFLDNFEQIISAAPLLGDLLSRAPRLKIMVSSREALRTYGEQNFPVHPLSLPGGDEPIPVPELAHYDAIRLFVGRASAIEPTFALSEENAPGILAICRGLEGVPLAIELAAARTWDLTPTEIQLGLSGKLELLSEGPRDLPARQRTLRGAIDWSYDILSPAERTLLSRMSVFVGGCSLDAVQAVCGGTEGAGKPGHSASPQTNEADLDVRSILASLLAKSLVQQHTRLDTTAKDGANTGGERRLYMLETIREYAWERLLESGEGGEMQRRHAQYYLALAEDAEPHLEARRDGTWLDHLEPEHGNLRTALDWSKDAASDASERPGTIEVGLRLAGALRRFWEMRGYVTEGRWYLDQLLQQEGVQEPGQATGGDSTGVAIREKALRAAGLLALYQGDFPSARALYEERLALARDKGGDALVASALNDLGVAARAEADYDYAKSLYEESLKIRRKLGDRPGIASSLNSLGTLALVQGNLSLAHSLTRESLEIRRDLGSKFGIALSLHNLGEIERSLGNFEGAHALYDEYLRLCEEMDDKPGTANALHNLGQVARHEGNWERSGTLFRQSLGMYLEWDDRPGIAECLAGLAELAVHKGQPESAALLFGAVDAVIDATNFHFSPPDQVEFEHNLSLARQALGEASFLEWTSQGRTMSLEDAVSRALMEQLEGD